MLLEKKHATVEIKAGSSENAFTMTAPELHNANITGSVLREKRKQQESRDVASISALQVSQTEFLWWMQKLPVVITIIEFIHVPSIALEYRGGKFFQTPRR